MEFLKTSLPELTGTEKAAILLAELGPGYNNNYDALMEALNLSTDEKEKIRRAMERLGAYAPAQHGLQRGLFEIRREEAVLSEAIEYGKRRGIFRPLEPHELKNKYVKNDGTNGLSDLAKTNPKAVADILSGWINGED